MPVKIFVEGIADKKFISDYLKYLEIEYISEKDIIDMGGINQISNFKHEFKRNTDNGGVNLLIVDADNDFEKRKTEIEEIKSKEKLEFDYFIIPNNCNAGTLKNLLENIINPENKIIFEKWQNFENSLKEIGSLHGKTLTIPAKKTKMYMYLEVLLGDTNKDKEMIKEKNRDYLNPEHWDMENSFLFPLREFLAAKR